ncbi:MAG: DNA polymerase I [Clostridia bacterium]|nr:DNA polymerase I [Clostridia bacterium]
MPSKMLLVDGNSLMHRAFHALPVMTSETGEYTNALHGFMMMLLRVMDEEKPDLIAVAFDRHAPTFRHIKYDEYKAGRAATPDELRAQFITIRELLAEMNISMLEMDGYEADDLLGSMSLLCEEQGIDALIITGDRDAFQLSGEHTTVLYTKQGIKDTERVTPAFIREKYGVEPVQLIDVKGLMGDTSDNIPGIAGIGEKTALKLIIQYGSLEEALDKAEAEQKGKLRERLMNGRESAAFSKWLATIDRHAPLTVKPGDCPVKRLGDGLKMLNRLQLKQVAARLSMMEDQEAAEEPEIRTKEMAEGEKKLLGAEEFRTEMADIQADVLALSMGSHISVALSDGRQFALKLGGDLIEPGVDEAQAVEMIRPAAERAGKVILHDLKTWRRAGLTAEKEIFDVMLAAYLINPQRKGFSQSALCEEAGAHPDDVFAAGALMKLSGIQEERLKKDGMLSLLTGLEQPFATVLAGMEQAGFMTDKDALTRLDEKFTARISELLASVREIAGDSFNPNSPKQLGTLLFETLGLPGGKKTKTGWSTSADILENMEDQHPLIPLILEYRKYTKLKSTYIDALLRLRDGEGRIHTSFDQVATATGRISSLEPNLQNIPVRTPLGREIRSAFVAQEGWTLVDADYSQIELRVLAHMSGDEVMCEAFRLNQDIHSRTAAEVYGVPIEEVTGEMRSAAKAVNFGIVYGISDFGLAKNIGVSRAEAAQFIERYLGRYPRVKKFMDGCVTQGNTEGFVSTLMGRRRYLPELSDRSYNIRQFGERAAMNSPIQGTAADIIKLAMVRVHEALTGAGLRARLILQVHDELIVEAPEEEAAQVAKILKETMESVMELSVPLTAEVNAGRSWFDCK